MTNEEKAKIASLRERGYGYKKIAGMLGLSPDTVKAHCRRNNLNALVIDENRCRMCGKPLEQIPGKKPKKFCSDICRNKWWNSHLDQVKRKAIYEYVCPCCHKPFGRTEREHPGKGHPQENDRQFP